MAPTRFGRSGERGADEGLQIGFLRRAQQDAEAMPAPDERDRRFCRPEHMHRAVAQAMRGGSNCAGCFSASSRRGRR